MTWEQEETLAEVKENLFRLTETHLVNGKHHLDFKRMKCDV